MKEKQTIIVARSSAPGENYAACLSGVIGICGGGRSPAEAIGSMLIDYGEYFSFNLNIQLNGEKETQ